MKLIRVESNEMILVLLFSKSKSIDKLFHLSNFYSIFEVKAPCIYNLNNVLCAQVVYKTMLQFSLREEIIKPIKRRIFKI